MYFKLSVMLMDEIKGAPGTPGFKVSNYLEPHSII